MEMAAAGWRGQNRNMAARETKKNRAGRGAIRNGNFEGGSMGREYSNKYKEL